jgi:hypothetical protein
MKKHIQVITAALVLCSTTSALAAPNLMACPALDASGKAIPLSPAAKENATTNAQDAAPIPSNMRQAADAAAVAIGKFESSSSSPWSNVSGHETISVGFLQWNWHTKSLVSTFLKAMPIETIELAANPLRADLLTLKALATSPGDSAALSAAESVIKSWTTTVAGDRLQDSKLRSSVVSNMQQWLALPQVTQIQRNLIESKLRTAHALALQWRTDTVPSQAGQSAQTADEMSIKFFFDTLVFNGGRGGIWKEHVDEYKKQFASNAEIVKSVADWLRACTRYELVKTAGSSKNTAASKKKVYGEADSLVNTNLWSNAVTANPKAFSDEQVNLLVFALLRAQRSEGSNPPKGFPGIYQADVLNRRGSAALNIGQVHGKKYPFQ